MANTWTAAQLTAMQQKNKTILVSAAAGSGKTATLTQRIIRTLTDKEHPGDISRMLIVTFTRAAAAELKERISGALADALAEDPQNKYLFRQMLALNSAAICTIDSFYLDIVKANFQKVSLPPKFRIGDEAELSLLHRLKMNELIDEAYAAPDGDYGDFSALVENFTGMRDDAGLADLFLSLYQSLTALPEGIGYLAAYADRLEAQAHGAFWESDAGRVLCQTLTRSFSHFEQALRRAVSYFDTHEKMSIAYSPAFTYDLNFCSAMLRHLQAADYDAAKEHMASYAPLRLGSLKATEKTETSIRYQDKRSAITKEIRRLTTGSFSLTPDQITSSFLSTASLCRRLYRFLEAYDIRINAEKRTRGICEFADLKRLACALLVEPDGSPTPLALTYREKYDEIYIDEYQDVDFVQDRIFAAIAKPDNRFMVGDIKQSIYSFRGAQPAVFAHYKKTFPTVKEAEGGDSCSIYMSENFRCDKNIIRFSNLIFSHLFGICRESIDYKESDELIFAKKPPFEAYASPRVQVVPIYTASEREEEDEERPPLPLPEDSTPIDPEALYIVQEIERLINGGKKADGTPVTPRDIAVIARSKAVLGVVSAALEAYGIPHADATVQSLFESPEVLLLLCLLTAIDNPQKDIYLAGILRSPLFRFTLEDLIVIRQAADRSHSLFAALVQYTSAHDEGEALAEKGRYFLDKLSTYRRIARGMSVDRLIRYLTEDLHLTLLSPPGSQNLLKFYEYARHFESSSFRGLYHFIQYINNILEDKTVIEGGRVDADADCVRLMTIHQSKGLEFPVCFVCGTAKRFNRDDLKKSMLFDPTAGLGIRLSDASGFARCNNPIREAIAEQIERLQTEEEMRILYVAMTRARERLYLTGKLRKAPEKAGEAAQLAALFPDAYTVLGGNNYMDWIRAALALYPEDDSFALCELRADELSSERSLTHTDEGSNDAPDAEEITALRTILHDRFTFSYPYAHLTKLPAKLSVSRLYPGVIDEEESLDTEALPDFAERPLLDPSQGVRASAAERGTATHVFLQFCDFAYATRHGVSEEIARLVEHRFLDRETAERIRIPHLEAFFRSRFFGEIKRACRIEREFRFHVMLPAADFTQEEAFAEQLREAKIAVQGVIDLLLEDAEGALTLCDYKTDHITPEEREDPALLCRTLTERHGRQLFYYSMAIEQIFGRRPEKILIYSLPYGETVPIDLKDLDPT